MIQVATHFATNMLDKIAIVTIGVAAVVYAVDRIAQLMGWGRGPALLREENTDLIRRNDELDVEVTRLRTEVANLERQVAALEGRVADLQERDQTAVLAALEHHETTATKRWQGVIDILGEIRDVLRNGGDV